MEKPDTWNLTISQLLSKRNKLKDELYKIEREIIVIQSNCKHTNKQTIELQQSIQKFDCPDCLRTWYD